MKKPASAPVLPLYNPALPSFNRLVGPEEAATFCQYKFQEMGAELPEWASRHNLNVEQAMLMSTQPVTVHDPTRNKRIWKFKPEFAQAALSELGFPTETIWIKTPDSCALEVVFVLPPRSVKQYRQEQQEYRQRTRHTEQD
ncbi:MULTISPECIES: hypothetical protein [Hymenobacter]|uniref:Uncharacterized protein n=1 Tax=Hymenobacter mucosus TaxID=1411120 RepID=A0A239B9E7_9BACT|nr:MULTISPECIES: hypothetical protein [Hymenobacter]MDF7815575.1 hypothetical protein [Hymenobacter sp. YC55]SNS04480.1 hypothetical protein SAMN06269173_12013 [Hymenobacter mucosus]